MVPQPESDVELDQTNSKWIDSVNEMFYFDLMSEGSSLKLL